MTVQVSRCVRELHHEVRGMIECGEGCLCVLVCIGCFVSLLRLVYKKVVCRSEQSLKACLSNFNNHLFDVLFGQAENSKIVDDILWRWYSLINLSKNNVFISISHHFLMGNCLLKMYLLKT